jgi:hypothetical protein
MVLISDPLYYFLLYLGINKGFLVQYFDHGQGPSNGLVKFWQRDESMQVILLLPTVVVKVNIEILKTTYLNILLFKQSSLTTRVKPMLDQ